MDDIERMDLRLTDTDIKEGDFGPKGFIKGPTGKSLIRSNETKAYFESMARQEEESNRSRCILGKPTRLSM